MKLSSCAQNKILIYYVSPLNVLIIFGLITESQGLIFPTVLSAPA